MNKFKCLIFLIVLISCKTGNNNSQNGYIKDSLSYKHIQEITKENEDKLNQQKCDYKSLQEKLQSSEGIGIAAIPVASQLIKHCIGSLTLSEKDSVYMSFIKFFYTAVNSLNDSLYTQYKGLTKKLEKEINDEQTSDFKKCLNTCGLDLLMTEGTYYIDAKYDYFYSLFKGKVSTTLDDFLEIRSNELKQGFSEDAGLLISFDELYKRVINWEDFLSKYPDFFLKDYAEYYYSDYLSTLLTGMDNSPIFDYETQKLLPEVKNLYEKALVQKSSRKSSKIISDYYDLLKAKDFKMPENTQEFLKKNGLSSMLGVQPNTR